MGTRPAWPTITAMHLLIPFAACLPDGCRQAWANLTLPHLTQLLTTLTPLHAIEPAVLGTETSLSPPHEQALAAGMGLCGPGGAFADGLLPWGALHAHAQGLTATPPLPWAVITPVNWSVQTAHITMTDPAGLALDEADSQTLLAAMRPYFAEDGITLYDDTPGRWLACGEVFHKLPTAAIDRVVGRNVHDWQPKSAQAKLLRRLQSEMQMLLYTHPLTDQRSARGLPAVNSFWVSGTGDLPPGFATSDSDTPVVVADQLRGPALREDWAAWGRAWQEIDARHGAALLAAVKAGPARETGGRLTLCGERQAITWVNRTPGTWQRLRQSVSRKYRESFTQPLHDQL